MAKTLTQERLKELMTYDPETGSFIRNIPVSGRIKGSVVGFKTRGYIAAGVDMNQYLLHRLAFLWMTGSFPNDQVDHINHDRSDNRWLNLRECTPQENSRNRSCGKKPYSGTMGVYWKKCDANWHSSIRINGKNISVYHGPNIWKAIWRRKMAEIKYGFHPNHGT